MESPCMWPCITPIDYFPMLDPTLKVPRASGFITIRLLKNDECWMLLFQILQKPWISNSFLGSWGFFWNGQKAFVIKRTFVRLVSFWDSDNSWILSLKMLNGDTRHHHLIIILLLAHNGQKAGLCLQNNWSLEQKQKAAAITPFKRQFVQTICFF